MCWLKMQDMKLQDMKMQDMKMQGMNLQYMTSYENILHYSAVCILLNFKSFVYGECVNVENLTAPAHHKYGSVL